MFEYQISNRYFAQIPGGMEALGGDELSSLGATDVRQGYRGLYFSGDRAALYRVNYLSRYVTRVLAPLVTFPCHSTRYLYGKAREIPWPDFFGPDHSFAVFANVSNSKIRHSRYASLVLKDAITDTFRESAGRRPDVDRVEPDLWINLHIENNRATIGLDTSGGSLHRRGYRVETVEAPMQETLAALIIAMSEWDGSVPLCDPMCGSGTLLSEALMLYCRVPAGYLRRSFGFEFLPDYDRDIWALEKRKADRGIRELPEGVVSGSDISPGALEATARNLARLPWGDRVGLEVLDFRQIPDLRDRVIVCNPPYGIRMGRESDLGPFYREFGDFLKKRCTGSAAYVYFGNRRWISSIGLRPTWKRPFSNGGLDGRLVKFEMY